MDEGYTLDLEIPENNNAMVINNAEAQTNAITSSSKRDLPYVGIFTVQCALCFKWRLIPSKEKYEEIRAHILDKPFVCESANEWHRVLSCNDPADIHQDDSRVWAIDQPSIALPPPGWERLLRIRGEGCTRYYVAPCGKKLRSKVEVTRYLQDNPASVKQATVDVSQFSFCIPKPLKDNCARKRCGPHAAKQVDDICISETMDTSDVVVEHHRRPAKKHSRLRKRMA